MKPCCSDLCLLPYGQTQPSNRQHVGGWAEGQVEVDATGHLWIFLSIEPPAARGIGRDLNYAIVSAFMLSKGFLLGHLQAELHPHPFYPVRAPFFVKAVMIGFIPPHRLWLASCL